DLLPAFRQSIRGSDASDGDEPDHAARTASGYDSALDHHLHGILNPDCATGLEQQNASGTATVRPGKQFSASAVDDGAGCGYSVSLWRQDAPDTGGFGLRQTAGLRVGAGRYRQRGIRAKPDSAGGHN